MKSETLHSRLRARGVILRCPETIDLAPDLDPDRFEAGVVIHPGCRIAGAESAFGPSCRIGAEGPATLHNCRFGAEVQFAGGFADQATLLDRVSAGSGAHLRPGTLIEEDASIAHTVGLKQTILMPYVTLGSLINFCDCLMAGGTGPDNHSEVGSGFVHFNFTPRQDKATPSLIGDVPRGVLLDQPPIFLGGQGGLVGPCRIAYGVVLGAGQVCRYDHLQPGRLVIEPGAAPGLDRPFEPHQIPRVDRVLKRNLEYIGNLLALDQWYRIARSRFARAAWQQRVLEGARQGIASGVAERLRQLDRLHGICSTPHTVNPLFVAQWPQTRSRLSDLGAHLGQRTPEIEHALAHEAVNYTEWVRSLDAVQRDAIRLELQAIVDRATGCLPLDARSTPAPDEAPPPAHPAHPGESHAG